MDHGTAPQYMAACCLSLFIITNVRDSSVSLLLASVLCCCWLGDRRASDLIFGWSVTDAVCSVNLLT